MKRAVAFDTSSDVTTEREARELVMLLGTPAALAERLQINVFPSPDILKTRVRLVDLLGTVVWLPCVEERAVIPVWAETQLRAKIQQHHGHPDAT